MPGLIGKKLGMTSLYSAEGKLIPCTIIEAGPCVVTQVKTQDKDGYEAVQLGYGDKPQKNTPNALKGHFKKAKTDPKRKLAEFRGFEEAKLGAEFKVDVFDEGDFVDVIGTSKGKGFQGVVKRHGFSGAGEKTHGQNSQKRASGSVGGASDPSKVFKGVRMAGQMGNNRVTMENLQVLKVMEDKNLVVVKGSIPGPKGSFVIIEK